MERYLIRREARYMNSRRVRSWNRNTQQGAIDCAWFAYGETISCHVYVMDRNNGVHTVFEIHGNGKTSGDWATE